MLLLLLVLWPWPSRGCHSNRRLELMPDAAPLACLAALEGGKVFRPSHGRVAMS